MKEYNESKIRNHYHELTDLLIGRGLTITTMESATSGQLASLITDTEGSSAVLKGAFVTYCNEAKIQQGVPAEILERYTVYSKETAEAMAEACRKAYDADIGIGVTGTMGNVDPANPEASVPGQVYFAIAMRGAREKSTAADILTSSYYVELAPQPTRLMYKLAVAEEIYQVLMEKLGAFRFRSQPSADREGCPDTGWNRCMRAIGYRCLCTARDLCPDTGRRSPDRPFGHNADFF